MQPTCDAIVSRYAAIDMLRDLAFKGESSDIESGSFVGNLAAQH